MADSLDWLRFASICWICVDLLEFAPIRILLMWLLFAFCRCGSFQFASVSPVSSICFDLLCFASIRFDFLDLLSLGPTYFDLPQFAGICSHLLRFTSICDDLLRFVFDCSARFLSTCFGFDVLGLL